MTAEALRDERRATWSAETSTRASDADLAAAGSALGVAILVSVFAGAASVRPPRPEPVTR